jgi:hypothetical protein
MSQAGQLEPTSLKGPRKRCIYDQETLCSAPRAQFQACKGCYRLNPRLAVNDLFAKIRRLAAELFNLPAPEHDEPPSQL